MADMGANMPFDGKRMIMGGFDAIVEEGARRRQLHRRVRCPGPRRQARRLSRARAKMAKVFRQHGATRVIEAIADDVQHGKVTDFYRAVKAEDGETVVFSFIEWPDKSTRDEAWKAIMADESLKPEGDMPFDGQRMFWGGFETILDTAKARGNGAVRLIRDSASKERNRPCPKSLTRPRPRGHKTIAHPRTAASSGTS